MCLHLVEGGEQGCDGLLVGLLCRGESGLVNAIVHVVVDPFVGGVNFGAMGSRVEVQLLVLLGKEIVEFIVEHADNLGALLRGLFSWRSSLYFEWRRKIGIQGDAYLIAYNPAGLLIEEHWDSKATRIVGVIGEVDITEMSELLVKRVGNGVLAGQVLVGGDKAPSYLVDIDVSHRHESRQFGKA